MRAGLAAVSGRAKMSHTGSAAARDEPSQVATGADRFGRSFEASRVRSSRFLLPNTAVVGGAWRCCQVTCVPSRAMATLQPSTSVLVDRVDRVVDVPPKEVKHIIYLEARARTTPFVR